MDFVDIEFPPRIAMGAQRRTGWRTGVVQVASGRESTNQEWSKARHAYDVSFAVRTASDYDAVVAHFHTVRGRAKSFPFRDPLDYTATLLQGVLLEDEELGSPVGYRLAKRYGTGNDAWDRPITRPVTGSTAVYRRRAGATVDISAQSSIVHTTGAITFNPGVYVPATDVITWSGRFNVPCRYDVDELPAIIVDRQLGGGELLINCESIPVLEVRE